MADQDGHDDAWVAGEVVVERDRYGKSLTAPSLGDASEQVLGIDDAIPAAEMSHLGVEEARAVRRQEISFQISPHRSHRVVDQRDADLPAGEPE
jgi:hypothetical protein